MTDLYDRALAIVQRDCPSERQEHCEFIPEDRCECRKSARRIAKLASNSAGDSQIEPTS